MFLNQEDLNLKPNNDLEHHHRLMKNYFATRTDSVNFVLFATIPICYFCVLSFLEHFGSNKPSTPGIGHSINIDNNFDDASQNFDD